MKICLRNFRCNKVCESKPHNIVQKTKFNWRLLSQTPTKIRACDRHSTPHSKFVNAFSPEHIYFAMSYSTKSHGSMTEHSHDGSSVVRDTAPNWCHSVIAETEAFATIKTLGAPSMCHRPHASVLLDERYCVECGGRYYNEVLYIAGQRLIWVDSLFRTVRPLIIENINKCKLKKKNASAVNCLLLGRLMLK